MLVVPRRSSLLAAAGDLRLLPLAPRPLLQHYSSPEICAAAAAAAEARPRPHAEQAVDPPTRRARPDVSSSSPAISHLSHDGTCAGIQADGGV
jgi:hypothetical protein